MLSHIVNLESLLSSPKWPKCLLGYMKPSYVWFRLWPNRPNIKMLQFFFFLRCSPWSRAQFEVLMDNPPWQRPREIFFWPIVNPMWWIEKLLFWKLWFGAFFRERKFYYRILFFFSLWIVKLLQLHGRRQISEPRKFCLVWCNHTTSSLTVPR